MVVVSVVLFETFAMPCDTRQVVLVAWKTECRVMLFNHDLRDKADPTLGR